MDLGSVRRGGISPGAGDSVESGSPTEGIKHEAEATASSLTSATAMPNGAGAGASGAADAMETTEAEEVENVTKKRKTGSGSRGVANLTPEQLAKKRANGECLPYSYIFPTHPPLIAAYGVSLFSCSIHDFNVTLVGTTQ